jgi:hypothetical protein
MCGGLRAYESAVFAAPSSNITQRKLQGAAGLA